MNWNHQFGRWILIILFIKAATFFCTAQNNSGAPLMARNGVIDLRDIKFETKGIPLNGEWKFYWESLIGNPRQSDYFELTPFPKLWKNTLWKNKPISSQGCGTYAVNVLLPKRHPQLALKIPDTYTSYRLYVNHKLIANNGQPGKTKEATIPMWSNLVKPILTNSDTLQLVLQVSNFHHVKGGPSKEIQIGTFSTLQAESSLNHAYDHFLTGCIFMGGFFFLGLYLFGRHDKSILYFSLFCLCYSYRIIGSRQYTLHSMLPDLNWNFAIHCEYISLFLAVGMFALYTRYLYPEDAPQKTLSGLAGICLGFVLITVISPPILFTRLIDFFVLIIITSIVFATVIYWKAFRKKRIGALYALMSTASIFMIVISIVMEYYGVATPFDFILFLGYLVFFFCQSLILTFRFAYSLKKAKEEAEIGLKVKSEFLSTMSHEIRTPLNSVIGMTNLMIKDGPRPQQKEQLDVLLFSANNLLTIVNDVLDFSTIEEGKIRFNEGPMDISSIARNIISGYKAAADNVNVEFILDLSRNLPASVRGDSTRTSQIIGNLVHNAIKFTSSGHVKLSVLELNRNEDSITLKIAVEDTGIGIPLDKQAIIFERFTQADSSSSRGFGGTGLGLAISKRILELQGIELKLNSEPDKGSVFYFVQTFPILKNSIDKLVASVKPSIANPLAGVTILVVEDNPMNVLVLQNFLKRWGASLEVAHNGKEALGMLNSVKHQLILMDLHMPVMDGYETTKHLRHRGETIPIIALTASAALDVENEVYGIGINDIVVKPFVPDELLRVILAYVKPQKVSRL